MVEIGLCLFSLASTVASVETGHWFAMPFAMLFTFGYGYVAYNVASEQHARRKMALAQVESGALTAQAAAMDSVPPPTHAHGASAAEGREELAA